MTSLALASLSLVNDIAYQKLLAGLESARLILDANAGELNAADLRLRCLLNTTLAETQRARREAAQRSDTRNTVPT